MFVLWLYSNCNSGEITPASPVNIIGKIISPDKKILNDIHSERVTSSLQS